MGSAVLVAVIIGSLAVVASAVWVATGLVKAISVRKEDTKPHRQPS